MNRKGLLQEALGKLRHRFPLAFVGITSLPDRDWDDERGWANLLEDFIARCKWDILDNYYAQRLNSLFEQEHGKDAGVGMVNGSLELRCRALIRALEDLS